MIRCTKMPGVCTWSASMLPVGSIDPDHVHTPGVFVQRMIVGTGYARRIEQRTTRPRPQGRG